MVVEYTECMDNQDGQGGQDGHAPPVTTLAALPREEDELYGEQSIPETDAKTTERQDGHAPRMTTLTNLPKKGVG